MPVNSVHHAGRGAGCLVELRGSPKPIGRPSPGVYPQSEFYLDLQCCTRFLSSNTSSGGEVRTSRLRAPYR